MSAMILIGVGANLDHPVYGAPRRTCGAALAALEAAGLRVGARGRWYRSEPVVRNPADADPDQPWYANTVITLDTAMEPDEVLSHLLATEQRLGRVRGARDAPRTVDLDLLAYHDLIADRGERLILPHPRMHERLFVLLPLCDIDPDWRHPTRGETVGEMIGALASSERIEPVADADGAFGTEWHGDAVAPAREAR